MHDVLYMFPDGLFCTLLNDVGDLLPIISSISGAQERLTGKRKNCHAPKGPLLADVT